MPVCTLYGRGGTAAPEAPEASEGNTGPPARQAARSLRAQPQRPYVLCRRVMSSGGGRFERRLDLREPLDAVDAVEPCLACACLGDGTGMGEGMDFGTALIGGWPYDAEREAERGGRPEPSGEGLIVDEKGTYIAEAGMPVGVDVRSEPDLDPDPDEPEPEPYELSEAGEAGVTVAESHADWRIFADLFAERCAVIGVCATSGDGAGASEPCEGGPVTIFSASKVDERSAELFIVEERIAEDTMAALRSVPERGAICGCFSDGRRIWGVLRCIGRAQVVRTGEGCALWRTSRVLNHGYVRALAPQIWESSFMWTMAETIRRTKYASAGHG